MVSVQTAREFIWIFNRVLFSPKFGKHGFGKQATRIAKHTLMYPRCHMMLKIKWQGLQVRTKIFRCKDFFMQTEGDLWEGP